MSSGSDSPSNASNFQIQEVREEILGLEKD